MTSLILGSSDHIDLCSSVHFFFKFGLKYLFDAIIGGETLIIKQMSPACGRVLVGIWMGCSTKPFFTLLHFTAQTLAQCMTTAVLNYFNINNKLKCLCFIKRTACQKLKEALL